MHFGDVGVDENDTYRKLPHMGLFVLAWRGIVYSLALRNRPLVPS